MPWVHDCKVPGQLLIKLKRARPGAKFACSCGKIYQLGMRGDGATGRIRYSWISVEDHKLESNTSDAKPGTGFQANSN